MSKDIKQLNKNLSGNPAEIKHQMDEADLQEMIDNSLGISTVMTKPKIDLRNLEIEWGNTYVDGMPVHFVKRIKGISDWDSLAQDIIADLNLFEYNGVIICKDRYGNVKTLEDKAELVIRKHTASLIKNISPSLNKQIAAAVEDRIQVIEPDLNNDIIYFNNGDYNIKTGKFSASTSPDFNHRRIPHDYENPVALKASNPGAFKAVDDFLNLASEGDIDIKKQIYEMIGISLLPTGVFRKSFFMDGEGGNGKSSILSWIQKVHGQSKISSVRLEHLSGPRAPFMTLGLANKTVNVIDDLSVMSMKENGVWKSLVAGEIVNAEVKGGKQFTFHNEATFIAGGNGVPNINDKGSSTAVLDRMVIIPLRYKFAKTPAGFAARNRMMSDECIQLVASLSAYAAHKAHKHGMVKSVKSVDALNEYETKTNTIKYWFDTVNPFDVLGLVVPSGDLYNEYKEFTKSAHLGPVGVHNFNDGMKKLLGSRIEIGKPTYINGKTRRCTIYIPPTPAADAPWADEDGE